jgi:hypothetical protein
LKQEVTVTALAHALSRAFHSSHEFDALKLVIIFSGIGLLASAACLAYGLDLSAGFF